MKLHRTVAFLALLMGLGFTPLQSQVRPPGQQRQRQQMERRADQGLARLVQNQLGLTQEQMPPLQEVMQSFREDRRAIGQAQAALRYRLRNPALGELSDDGAREILAEMVRVQEAELDLYRREQERLLTVLSPNQLVRFYRVREEWGQRIQEMRQPGNGRGQGPRGVGMGPTLFPDGFR